MKIDRRILNPNPARQAYLPILEVALSAVEPRGCTRQALRRSGDRLWVGERVYDLDRVRDVYVVGCGKAGAPMVQGVEDVLGDHITAGVVVVKEGHVAPTRQVRLVEAGHPLPDARSVMGARAVVDLLQRVGERDLVIVLISGGGSALLTLPAPGLALQDLQELTDLLLRCGATIEEINTLRKHCSAVKGGQLARQMAPARVLGLVLSDVVGNSLATIASGPLVPDPTTFADAWAVVEKYGLGDSLPPAVREHLQAGLHGRGAETPKPGEAVFDQVQVEIVGDNALAAEGGAQAAAEAGYHAQVLTTFVEGEAREVAWVAAALGKEVVRHARPCPAPACLILGGETTVTLRGGGTGGRNQELALAAALALEGWSGITVVALGTDGNDGPTDAAGGMVDGSTAARARAAGLDPLFHLQDNDAYPLLQATDDLLITGPTNTNVNDLILILVERSEMVWPSERLGWVSDPLLGGR
ncbi:MAG TPA: glycerate kinase [Chloroflexi bacterium]|nr:glycerate kinase [Chloroflexota bacterium]